MPNQPKEKLIRPVKCHFCNAPMFYSDDEKHEPEISVTINGSIFPNDDSAGFHFYAHVRCWNEKMKP